MADSDKRFNEIWEEGFNVGMEEGCLNPSGTESHEAFGDVFCTAFYAGVAAINAWRNGVDAARTLKISCCHLADKEDPGLAKEWMRGMWSVFEEEDAQAFEA